MSIQNSWEQKYISLEHCISALSLKKCQWGTIDFRDHFYRNLFTRKMEEINTSMQATYAGGLEIKFIADFT